VSAPARPIVAVAVIALVEGLALLGYAVFDLIEAVRVGVTGPADVSNVPALALLIAITAAFGAGLVWIARGWWLRRRWARSPFLLAQIIGVLIGWDLSQSEGTVERAVGIALALLCVLGIILAFAPGVTAALQDGDDTGEA
jgi:hypothetical protein